MFHTPLAVCETAILHKSLKENVARLVEHKWRTLEGSVWVLNLRFWAGSTFLLEKRFRAGAHRHGELSLPVLILRAI